MSADNGYILRKRGNTFVIHHYFVSGDIAPDIVPDINAPANEFTTLVDALAWVENAESKWETATEYGLTIALNPREGDSNGSD